MGSWENASPDTWHAGAGLSSSARLQFLREEGSVSIPPWSCSKPPRQLGRLGRWARRGKAALSGSTMGQRPFFDALMNPAGSRNARREATSLESTLAVTARSALPSAPSI
ncbi:hypothetical protein NPIL_535421 [Nephila pilipes]|uniref:Uncharacterized protein n=1 Tax=Nephila pilipes TaxID=299642 RepID=A0A8X6PEX3_NEPPI|nr:hypothetical protein NPIL_535421 [Nephila pilipes]